MEWVQLGIWGDSLVHGGIDMEKGGWVTRLRLYLMGRGLGDHCFGLGVGGQNSGEVLRRLGPELTQRIGHIDHVLLSVGLNDLLNKEKLTPVPEFAENLRRMAREVRAAGKKPWILSMTPCDRPGSRDWGAMVEASCRAAEEEGAEWLDMSASFSLSDLVDGVHPGPAGHEKIFQAVKTALIKGSVIPPE